MSEKKVKQPIKLDQQTEKIQIAVIGTGGKQYIVKVGDELKIERLPDKPTSLEFKDLLHNKKVKAKILGDQKSKKVTGVKFKKRKGYLKFFGHRQNQTIIKILSIK
jgi:large subunit ribosomal protein L21